MPANISMGNNLINEGGIVKISSGPSDRGRSPIHATGPEDGGNGFARLQSIYRIIFANGLFCKLFFKCKSNSKGMFR